MRIRQFAWLAILSGSVLWVSPAVAQQASTRSVPNTSGSSQKPSERGTKSRAESGLRTVPKHGLHLAHGPKSEDKNADVSHQVEREIHAQVQRLSSQQEQIGQGWQNEPLKSLHYTPADQAQVKVFHPLLTPQIATQIKVRTPLMTPKDWARVRVRYAGSGKASGPPVPPK